MRLHNSPTTGSQGTIETIQRLSLFVLPVAAGEKVGTERNFLKFYFYIMTRYVILHYNS